MMTKTRLWLLPCLLSLTTFAAPAAAAEGCIPLAGAERLTRSDGPDFILFGEAHGTRELPHAFADLVCTLAFSRRPLVVALEFLSSEQAALDAFVRSDGGPAARAVLLASPGWGDRHGRASEAILALLESLRRQAAAGADLTVLAFDHPSRTPGTSAEREWGMARHLLDARARRPHARIVALTGIGHAGKSLWTSLGRPFPAMAQYLPPDRSFSLAFHRGGGEYWACRRPAEGAPEECRAWPATMRDPPLARGLHLDPPREGFDGLISTGGPFSASPPARDAR